MADCYRFAPWHFLNFLPEPQGHGSFRPTFDQSPGPVDGVAAAGLSDRVRPAPTTTGSCRATTFFFGGSAGPTSITSASAVGGVPLSSPSAPSSFRGGSSSGISSRIPSALKRFVGFRGPSGPFGTPSPFP